MWQEHIGASLTSIEDVSTCVILTATSSCWLCDVCSELRALWQLWQCFQMSEDWTPELFLKLLPGCMIEMILDLLVSWIWMASMLMCIQVRCAGLLYCGSLCDDLCNLVQGVTDEMILLVTDSGLQMALKSQVQRWRHRLQHGIFASRWWVLL